MSKLRKILNQEITEQRNAVENEMKILKKLNFSSPQIFSLNYEILDDLNDMMSMLNKIDTTKCSIKYIINNVDKDYL